MRWKLWSAPCCVGDAGFNQRSLIIAGPRRCVNPLFDNDLRDRPRRVEWPQCNLLQQPNVKHRGTTGQAGNSVDGNGKTRWDSGASQTPGMWFGIELPELLEPSVLLLRQQLDADCGRPLGGAAFRPVLLARIERFAVVAEAPAAGRPGSRPSSRKS